MDHVRNHQVAQATHKFMHPANRPRDRPVAATRMGRVVSSTQFSVLWAVVIQVAEVVVHGLLLGTVTTQTVVREQGGGMAEIGRLILEVGVSKLIEFWYQNLLICHCSYLNHESRSFIIFKIVVDLCCIFLSSY